MTHRLWLGADLRAVGLGCAAAHGRARRPAARGRPRRRGGVLRAQPLHGRLHGPHERQPARLRRAALAAADRLPRRAAVRGWRGATGAAGGGPPPSRWCSPRSAAASTARSSAGCSSARWCSCSTSRSSAVRWRDSARFLLRMGGLGTLASLWWIVPLVVHARYGIDFLQFTEQPRTIWATNNAAEALRLMAYWTSYVGVGFGGATRRCSARRGRCCSTRWSWAPRCCCPALAVAGFVWTRRWRYAPFLLLILLVGVTIEVAGFPNGTPARDGDGVDLPQRPVLPSCARPRRPPRSWRSAWPGCSASRPGWPGRGCARWPGPAAARRAGRRARRAGGADRAGRAAARARHGRRAQLTWDRIPEAWTEAGARPRPRAAAQHARARAARPDLRLLQLGRDRRPDPPAAHRTAGRRPLRDALRRPARVRPAGDGRPARGPAPPVPRAARPAAAPDGRRRRGHRQRRRHLAQRRRPTPRPPRRRSPPRAWAAPRAATAPAAALPPARGDVGPATVQPQVRRYDLPGGRGIVTSSPRGPATVVDGGAEGSAGAGRLRRAARAPPAALRGRPDRRRAAPRGRARRRGRGHRLQPAPPLPARVRRPEPRPDAGRERAARPEPREHRPVSRAAAPTRRPSPSCRARATCAPPQGGGLLEFPEHGRSRPSTATRRRAGPPTATPSRATAGSRSASSARATSPTSTSCRCATGAASSARSTSTACAPIGPGVTRVPVRQTGVRALRITITGVDQPGGRPARRRGLPRDPHPGRPLRQALRRRC